MIQILPPNTTEYRIFEVWRKKKRRALQHHKTGVVSSFRSSNASYQS